jgi:hypothetical protein
MCLGHKDQRCFGQINLQWLGIFVLLFVATASAFGQKLTATIRAGAKPTAVAVNPETNRI